MLLVLAPGTWLLSLCVSVPAAAPSPPAGQRLEPQAGLEPKAGFDHTPGF